MSFVSLHTGLSGLRAAQAGVDVTANNVANAATPGHTRQRLELRPRAPFDSPVGQIGAGVEVTDIVRLRDTFLDGRVRLAMGDAAAHDARATVLGQLEDVLAEPDSGLTTELDELWATLEDWTLDPTSSATRSLVLDRLASVSARFNEVGAGAAQLRDSTRVARDQQLGSAQQTLTEIARINAEVRNASEVDNQLLDRRDVLADEVAALLGATSTLQSDGSLTVQVGATVLVQGDAAATLTAVGDVLQVDGSPVPDGTFGGEVGGLHTTVVGDVPDVLAALDDVAAQLADSINAQHAAGVTADGTAGAALLAYTPGSAAATLAVTTTDPAALAARADGSAGAHDATNAVALADLRTSLTARTDGQRHESALQAVVVDVGSRVAAAGRAALTAGDVAVAAEANRTSAHGVSIDEEMVALVQYQRALEANSRVMTAADEMLDTIVNRLGRVGR